MAISIYFAKECNGGLVKVGRSRQVAERIRQLRNEEGCAVTLLAQFDCGENHPGWCERVMLCRFADKRVRGDWFRLEDSDIATALKILSALRREDVPDGPLWPIIPWRRESQLNRKRDSYG